MDYRHRVDGRDGIIAHAAGRDGLRDEEAQARGDRLGSDAQRTEQGHLQSPDRDRPGAGDCGRPNAPIATVPRSRDSRFTTTAAIANGWPGSPRDWAPASKGGPGRPFHTASSHVEAGQGPHTLGLAGGVVVAALEQPRLDQVGERARLRRQELALAHHHAVAARREIRARLRTSRRSRSASVRQMPVTIEMPRPIATYCLMTSQPPTSSATV